MESVDCSRTLFYECLNPHDRYPQLDLDLDRCDIAETGTAIMRMILMIVDTGVSA